MAREIIKFKKSNPQEDYMYMAKDVNTGDYHIGYIVVDKPWYSSEDSWIYYIVKNQYGEWGVCGGATDLGFEKYIVDRTTIEPFTQIAQIKFNQSRGLDSVLVKNFLEKDDENNRVAFIGANSTIPLELWQ